jgi:hypothetical protein
VIRDVDELELEPVGVGKEHGVVARLVAVLGRRVEDLDAAAKSGQPTPRRRL